MSIHLTFKSRLPAVLLAMLACAPMSGSVVAQVAEPAAPFALIQPPRRAPDAAAGAPADLPPAARHVKPMAFDLVIHRRPTVGQPHSIRQRVERTADRMHIAEPDGSEWLFESNPVDARRVTGSFIDHAAREIVVYEDSELRNVLGIPGWADVLMFGVTPELLRGMERTGGERTVGDIRFTRYTALNPKGATRELWWNDDQLMPAALVASNPAATVEFNVEKLSSSVPPDRLRAPAARYPDYRVIDFADRLERH